MRTPSQNSNLRSSIMSPLLPHSDSWRATAMVSFSLCAGGSRNCPISQRRELPKAQLIHPKIKPHRKRPVQPACNPISEPASPPLSVVLGISEDFILKPTEHVRHRNHSCRNYNREIFADTCTNTPRNGVLGQV